MVNRKYAIVKSEKLDCIDPKDSPWFMPDWIMTRYIITWGEDEEWALCIVTYKPSGVYVGLPIAMRDGSFNLKLNGVSHKPGDIDWEDPKQIESALGSLWPAFVYAWDHYKEKLLAEWRKTEKPLPLIAKYLNKSKGEK